MLICSFDSFVLYFQITIAYTYDFFAQQGKITLEFTIKLNTIQVTFLSSLPKISENNKVEENGWNSFNQATGQKLEILKFYKLFLILKM
jgi:hypothetical protein